MTVTLNGASTDLPDDLDLVGLLTHLGRDPQTPGVAVAVNLEVVAPHDWASTRLCEGDRIDVVVAVGGG